MTDLTQTLTTPQQQTLETRLEEFERAKGSQIAVLIIPATQPEAIEQYSIRVVEKWKLGRKKIDDGALLLIAKNDRSLRIEVGYGLEGVLTDATSKQIIDDVIVPYFKRGDFYGGVDAGVSQMMKVIEGEPLPSPKNFSSPGSWFRPELAIFAIVLVVVLGNILRGLLGRPVGASLTGTIVAGIGWVMAIPLGIAIVMGILAFLSVLFDAGKGGTGGGRWGAGGPGGGWGGGGSGGGFGGGGGGFGGGGASGRW